LNYLWLIYALLAAVTAALVSIFGKLGIQSVDVTTATAIRAVIMALFLIILVFSQGISGHITEILTNKKALAFITLSGIVGALSWSTFQRLNTEKFPKLRPLIDLAW